MVQQLRKASSSVQILFSASQTQNLRGMRPGIGQGMHYIVAMWYLSRYHFMATVWHLLFSSLPFKAVVSTLCQHLYMEKETWSTWCTENVTFKEKSPSKVSKTPGLSLRLLGPRIWPQHRSLPARCCFMILSKMFFLMIKTVHIVFDQSTAIQFSLQIKSSKAFQCPKDSYNCHPFLVPSTQSPCRTRGFALEAARRGRPWRRAENKLHWMDPKRHKTLAVPSGWVDMQKINAPLGWESILRKQRTIAQAPTASHLFIYIFFSG